jgi:hypothetical protein
MEVILIFIGIIVGLNCIPLLTKTNFTNLEKVIVKVLLSSTILFLTFTILKFSGYRLKGLYIFSTITWTFIFSTVLYFALFKNSKKKIFTIFLLTPLLILGFLALIIGEVEYENKIDKIYKISGTTGGFLACGENIQITQTRFIIFDKEVFSKNNLCLKGINKIETIYNDNNKTEILIYHNGEMDSENPYKETIEKTGW